MWRDLMDVLAYDEGLGRAIFGLEVAESRYRPELAFSMDVKPVAHGEAIETRVDGLRIQSWGRGRLRMDRTTLPWEGFTWSVA